MELPNDTIMARACLMQFQTDPAAYSELLDELIDQNAGSAHDVLVKHFLQMFTTQITKAIEADYTFEAYLRLITMRWMMLPEDRQALANTLHAIWRNEEIWHKAAAMGQELRAATRASKKSA